MADNIPPAVSRDLYYLDPDEHEPPLGRKLYILTRNGVGIIGMWDKESGFVGWRPFYKATQKMKDKINR